MATPRKAARPAKGKKAKSKAASGPAQGPIGNTGGVFVPVPKPSLEGGTEKIPVVAETEAEKSFLEKKQSQIQTKIDEWVERQGYGKAAMSAGALATAVNQVFFPRSLFELVPIGKAFKLLKKGKEGIEAAKKALKAEEAAKDAKKVEKANDVKKAGEKSGGTIPGKKRKPGRRCELVPYNELQCGPDEERHHVVPDWMLRLGKRGGPERIEGLPSLANGPAICLEKGSGKEHNTAHKHTDKPAQRIAKRGAATGTPGTLKLGQAKKISARAIEKATGGVGKGGCSKADIKQQLDQMVKAPDNAAVRGVKDSRKVTQSMRDALNGGKD